MPPEGGDLATRIPACSITTTIHVIEPLPLFGAHPRPVVMIHEVNTQILCMRLWHCIVDSIRDEHHCRPTTYRILCRIHGLSVACCRLPKGLGYTLTCIDADGVMHMMQKSSIHNALHPFITYLPAPTAGQEQCKTSSYSPA